MRFWLVVAVAAIAQVPMFLRVSDWIGIAAVLAIAFVMAAAAGAGFFARHRPALAGFLSVVLGALLAGIVAYVQSRAPSDVGLMIESELRILSFVIPYALAGMVAGIFGSWLRGRALRA